MTAVLDASPSFLDAPVEPTAADLLRAASDLVAEASSRGLYDALAAACADHDFRLTFAARRVIRSHLHAGLVPDGPGAIRAWADHPERTVAEIGAVMVAAGASLTSNFSLGDL